MKLFHRDFTMVVVGQIISLFGNHVLQYALPLYLLNMTHSPALFGLVSACAFLPMVLLAPVGGLIADRVDKRNVMVVLDFSTAALMALYTVVYGQMNLVGLLIVMLMLLYGIQGAYQPAVQASIPALVPAEELMSGNAVINMVASLAGMIGPALGGVLYGTFGLKPVLLVSIACFSASAVMECFIHIPFVRREQNGSVLKTAALDMKESFHFICAERPEAGKIGLLLAGTNLVFSALIIIGIPIIVTETMDFSQAEGNRLYGYAQAVLAAGGLLGGLLSGVLGKRLRFDRVPVLFFTCTLTLLPMAGVLMAHWQGLRAYLILMVCCFAMMVLSTLLSIQLMTYAQLVTPATLIGKVMALISCLAMCAYPLGQATYGMLFEHFAGQLGWIFLAAELACLGLCCFCVRIFSDIAPNPAVKCA